VLHTLPYSGEKSVSHQRPIDGCRRIRYLSCRPYGVNASFGLLTQDCALLVLGYYPYPLRGKRLQRQNLRFKANLARRCPPAHRDKAAMNGAQLLMDHGCSSGLMSGPRALSWAIIRTPSGENEFDCSKQRELPVCDEIRVTTLGNGPRFVSCITATESLSEETQSSGFYSAQPVMRLSK